MSADVRRYGFCITWKIVNFSFCHFETIASQYFTDENICQEPWHMDLYPVLNYNGGRIWCDLHKYPGNSNVIIDFKIEIIGPSGHILGAYETKNECFSKEKFSNGVSLIERSCIERDILETAKDTLTIRCYMSSAESINDNCLNCFTRTKVIVNHQSLRLRWTTLNEIRTLFESDVEKKHITTECIQFPEMHTYELYFHKSEDNVEIRIDALNFGIKQCVECKISLLDVNGCEVFTVKDRYQFSEDDDSWIIPTFLNISNLKVNQSKFIKNECLFILCELYCYGGMESQAVFYGNREIKLLANHGDNVITNHSLQSDIRNLFFDKNSCDTKIRGNDGIIDAHKSILISRSPVFRAMFQHEMLETQTRIVEMPDADIATLELLLNFFYSDTLKKVDYDSLKKLLILADKYEVPRLIEICASFLRSDISERNACDIASLANMVNHADLKSFALNFIVDHHTDIFIQLEWLPWTKCNMELATEVFQKLSEKQLKLRSFFVKI